MKKARLFLCGAITLGLCFSSVSQMSILTAHASTLVNHYSQSSITNISGHYLAEGSGTIPSDTDLLFAYGLGSMTLGEAVTWNVSDFTGFSVPSPVSDYQRGIDGDSSGYGHTSGQIYGTGMGFMVNKYSTGNPNPAGDLMGMQLLHSFSQWTVRPWYGYGTNAKLRLQVNYGTKGSYREGNAVQYGQLFINLVDTATTGYHNIWYVVNLWDSRGVQSESVARDTVLTSNFVVNTHLTSGTRYCERPDWSNQTNGTTNCVFYCAYVSRQSLINAINDINSTFNENLNTNPDNYIVNVIGCGPEMYSPSGTNGWVAASLNQCAMYTEY